MKYYEVTIPSLDAQNPSKYRITIEDGYVSRCEPSNRAYLGMREDTLTYHVKIYKGIITTIDLPLNVYLITWLKDGKTEMTVVGGRDPDHAIQEFIKVFHQEPLYIYERIGRVDKVTIPAYKIIEQRMV